MGRAKLLGDDESAASVVMNCSLIVIVAKRIGRDEPLK